jgi:hypothetical protein
MPKFAIYFVSPQSEFYQLGASIVGYDLRASQSTEMAPQIKRQIEYNQAWNQNTRPFGFHCTIGCSLDFHYAQLHAIEQEIEDILACFNPDHPFILRQAKKPIVFWGQEPQVVVLRYEANNYLQILHTLVTARMQLFGLNSRYLRSYLENPEQYSHQPFQARKILKFYYYPSILDDYAPHFTLFNPYTGKNKAMIERELTQLFHQYKQISVNSICLVIQKHDEAQYEIYREFLRDDFL